jgi:deoxyribodipyrimidine photolyase-related protein
MPESKPDRRTSRRVAVWIPADQLVVVHPALRRAEEEAGRSGVRVAIVESRAAIRRLAFHRKRQVLHLSAGRHFAEELRAEGYEVDLIAARDSREGLAKHLERHRAGRLYTMAAADHLPRRWQCGPMAEQLGVEAEVLPNSMFLVGRFDPIPDPEPGRRYVMESFYRSMRRRFGLLMEPDGSPTSGRWNLDAENRKRLPRGEAIPPIPRFEPDAITRRVMDEVEASGVGVGSAEGFDLPVTRADAGRAFDGFIRDRLGRFGPYEDAMSRSEGVLFHSMLSPQMNLGLLDSLDMARAAEREYREGRAPLNSAEGFIRQVVGWREFIYWQYHRQMPGLREANSWGARRPLPRSFWDGETDMECLRSVVGRLIDTGYTHHIERLMVLCNFATLAGIDPAAVADWFLAFYIDSHDWVVLPNVIGMGLNADGGLTATKPYIASASYLKRMGDFCGACSYRPDRRSGPDACPFNVLYWNFLIEHEGTLRASPRLGPAVLGLRRIGDRERDVIRSEARRFLDALEPYGDEDGRLGP